MFTRYCMAHQGNVENGSYNSHKCIATIVQNVVTEITNMAVESDPMYIAVPQAKKRAKNPAEAI